MSEHEPERDEVGISDDQLPDDLTPGDDNPLAEPLDDDETVDDLLEGGKQAEQSEDDDSDSDSGSGSGSDSDPDSRA